MAAEREPIQKGKEVAASTVLNPLSATGTLGRLQLLGTLLALKAFILLGVFLVEIHGTFFSRLVLILAGLFLLICGLIALGKRARDIGRSAWYALWSLVPLIGAIVVLYLLVAPSESRKQLAQKAPPRIAPGALAVSLLAVAGLTTHFIDMYDAQLLTGSVGVFHRSAVESKITPPAVPAGVRPSASVHMYDKCVIDNVGNGDLGAIVRAQSYCEREQIKHSRNLSATELGQLTLRARLEGDTLWIEVENGNSALVISQLKVRLLPNSEPRQAEDVYMTAYVKPNGTGRTYASIPMALRGIPASEMGYALVGGKGADDH